MKSQRITFVTIPFRENAYSYNGASVNLKLKFVDLKKYSFGVLAARNYVRRADEFKSD